MFYVNIYVCYMMHVIGQFLLYGDYGMYDDLQSSKTRKYHCMQ